MKKITIIEIVVVLIVILALGIYFAPRFLGDFETQKIAKVKSNNAIFTAKVLEEFAQNKKAKASDVAKKVMDELNKTNKNPYDKKLNAFTFEKECLGCNCVSYDDKNEMIVLTAYNKKNELIARTVIKPPSFVEYAK